MNTQTNKQEKVDTLILASFYAALILVTFVFNLVTYLIETI